MEKTKVFCGTSDVTYSHILAHLKEAYPNVQVCVLQQCTEKKLSNRLAGFQPFDVLVWLDVPINFDFLAIDAAIRETGITLEGQRFFPDLIFSADGVTRDFNTDMELAESHSYRLPVVPEEVSEDMEVGLDWTFCL